MNTNDSLLDTSIPQFVPEKDSFRVAEERRRWWTFLDTFLTQQVENQMVLNNPERKDAPMLSMLATDVARTLRASASFSEAGSTVKADELHDIKFRYPNQYEIVRQAVRLSSIGKTQNEILETFQAQIDKSLLESVNP